jgi:hypothetical protein
MHWRHILVLFTLTTHSKRKMWVKACKTSLLPRNSQTEPGVSTKPKTRLRTIYIPQNDNKTPMTQGEMNRACHNAVCLQNDICRLAPE